ncbi:sensor histidine kinase [Nocardia sp. XZ_19_385]|uniref:sensor histidine kinase n=1 Tax=Nocardia sp. XZ_19_385 TaxID=2769488 RepID=UPI00188EF571|nr:histidine kinase [Nocardia sp. XZ_19_385]
MKNSALLAITAAGGVLNGLAMEGLPPWRQALFAALAVAAYLQGRHLPVRRGGEVLLVATGAAATIAVFEISEAVSAVMTLALFVMLPWLIGRFRRQQSELITAGQDRIAHLEQTQELAAESARLRERARIATDMHDSLGHELALIALQAGALELNPDLTEPNRRSASNLRASAVAATDELRRTIALLRTETATAEPPHMPVAALVARARAAGMTVLLEDDLSSDPPPPLADSALRRIIQETLTNAARHAPGTPVTIRIEQHGDELAVAVTNPLTGTTPSTASAGKMSPRPDCPNPFPASADSRSAGRTDATPAPTGTSSGLIGRTDANPSQPSTNSGSADRTGASPSQPNTSSRSADRTGASPSQPNTSTGSVGRTATSPFPSSAGSGLIGLAERVELLGGTFQSSSERGDFTVTARIPLSAPTRAAAP